MRHDDTKNQDDFVRIDRYVMPGKQIVTLELQKLHLLLEDLKHHKEASDDWARSIQRCETLIRRGIVALDARVSLLPCFKFSNDDYVWGVLRAVKRELMRIVDVGDLKALLAECYDELSYVAGADQTELHGQLKHISDELEKPHGHDNTALLEALRNQLRSVAIRLDQARRDFWWKVNDYKIRMLIFAITLFLVLAGTVAFLSTYLSEPWWFFITIVLLGALGGLLGGLLRTEDVKAHLGAFFINRVHALLSPILGACGALAIYLLLKSGLIAIPSHLPMDNGIPYYFYAIAFFSGFSERLLLRLLEQGSNKFEPPGRKEKKARH